LDQYHFDQSISELYLLLDHWNHQLTYLNNSPQEICFDQSLYLQLIPWFQIIDYQLVQEVQHERSIKGSSQKGENIRKSLKQNIGIGKSYSGKHDIPCNLENEGKSVVLPKLLEHKILSQDSYEKYLTKLAFYYYFSKERSDLIFHHFAVRSLYCPYLALFHHYCLLVVFQRFRRSFGSQKNFIQDQKEILLVSN
jgi:hypothetical protein